MAPQDNKGNTRWNETSCSFSYVHFYSLHYVMSSKQGNQLDRRQNWPMQHSRTETCERRESS
ncbi:hypothetical protein E2C01_053747 [Portunus trituberculatus]|uniref:Uncharacterized protein n=1 Tax=Portunus trituberculatus TaxID=210409 RepID=A0A5B7GQ15_PORTR|nr:hypothetical protein [Portunus trituberculatus]